MRNLLDRWLGLGPDDDDAPADDATKAEVTELLEKHDAVLRQVSDVLSDSQRRVVDAIEDTGSALQRSRQRE